MNRNGAVRLMGVAIATLLTGAVGLWTIVGRSNLSPVAKAQAGVQQTEQTLEQQITLADVPRNVITLFVELASKREKGRAVQTQWDGHLEVTGARLVSLRLWQPDPRNSISGTSWKISTRHRIPWNTSERRKGHKAMPLKDAALLIELADVTPAAELKFDTVQGKFSVKPADVPPGARKTFLGGLVRVSRAGTARIVLSAPTEDDFPSACLGPDGKLYVAYVAFTHGKDFRRRQPLQKPPEDLSYLAQPTGGDQVFLLCHDGKQWQGPIAVTEPGQDVFGTAVATDGDGRVWVFWSGNNGGNWDIYARSFANGKWSAVRRITTDPGPDVFPVAVKDAGGSVWLAWQGFRGQYSDIFAVQIAGGQLGDTLTVCGAPGNQWTPALAAASDGRVAVAWDSYEKGDYDVYARIWNGQEFGPRITIANSARAEMRPSIAFDKAGRLWVAYEDSPEKWGKDWGALEKEGVALYQQRRVSVRVWANGRLWEPVQPALKAFFPWLRQPTGRTANLALPRLCVDNGGRVWLAVRSARLGTRVGVGTTWFEHLAYYEGDGWSNEVVCPRTDNLLDKRPALLATDDGHLLLVTASDRRFDTCARLPQWFIRMLRQEGIQVEQGKIESPWPDPVNNELVMAVIGPMEGAAPPPKLQPVELPAKRQPTPEAKAEAEQVAMLRSVRIEVGGKQLQLWRGEFHRHTEISSDGGGDGMLMDMWRYALDAASMDWIGNGDHDNGGGREYSWWIVQKTTDVFHVPRYFTPMFSYERSVSYPDGHRNVVFARRGVRTLPRLQGGMGKEMDNLPPEAERPNTPDTQLLYRYLEYFDGVCASHTSATDMGTDWRDNNPRVEPIVEIYQGCRQNYERPDAPRAPTADYAIGGWRPYGFVSLALMKGYRLGFQASSDHVSTHISYCNVWVEEPTREAILKAMKARHVYGSTDNILADVRCGEHFMGDEFTTRRKPQISVHLVGTKPFAKVHIIKDNEYVHTVEPGTREVQFTWTDFSPTPGKTSYYYVRGEQEDGELVWVSPMWITYKPE